MWPSRACWVFSMASAFVATAGHVLGIMLQGMLANYILLLPCCTIAMAMSLQHCWKHSVNSAALITSFALLSCCALSSLLLAESASMDAAVFCLALMGTDYGTFIKEAFRVLRPGGLLWIAEVRSRFVEGNGGRDVFSKFIEALKQQGLTVTQQDSSNKMFVVFEAKKVAEKCDVTVQWPELKPCLYKRR